VTFLVPMGAAGNVECVEYFFPRCLSNIGDSIVVEDECCEFRVVVFGVVMMMLRQHETETRSGAGQRVGA
jgi:hypothetical protein